MGRQRNRKLFHENCRVFLLGIEYFSPLFITRTAETRILRSSSFSQPKQRRKKSVAKTRKRRQDSSANLTFWGAGNRVVNFGTNRRKIQFL